MRMLVAVAAALLLGAHGLSAQVSAGLNELNLSGNISVVSADDESETIAALQLRYGRFVSRQFELGALLGATKFEDEDMFGTIGPFAAIHFGAEGATTVPYLGASAEFGFGHETDEPKSFAGFGGLKLFPGQAGSLNLELFLERTDLGGDFDYTTWGMRVGVSVYF